MIIIGSACLQPYINWHGFWYIWQIPSESGHPYALLTPKGRTWP